MLILRDVTIMIRFETRQYSEMIQVESLIFHLNVDKKDTSELQLDCLASSLFEYILK